MMRAQRISIASVFAVVLVAVPLLAFGQVDTAKHGDSVIVSPWKHQSVLGATLTQTSYQDWSAGGQGALAYALTIEGVSERDSTVTDWSNTYKLAFGQTRLSDEGWRKTDDKIDLETKLIYKVGLVVNPFAAVNFKTQFSKGYKYDSTNRAIAVSDIFDPAYLTQSIGLAYQPIKEFRTRFGLALQEIWAEKYPIYTDDPTTPGEETRKIQGGLESVTEVELTLDEHVLFKTKLEMFAPMKHLDVVVVRSDSYIIAKISKFFSANLNMQFINDANTNPRTQIKEALALGINYALF